MSLEKRFIKLNEQITLSSDAATLCDDAQRVINAANVVVEAFKGGYLETFQISDLENAVAELEEGK